jgi:hypothetical protein
MSKDYYLTRDGETFEEISLNELGRELLTYDGAKFDISVEVTLIHKKPIGGGNFAHWEELKDFYMMNETRDLEKAEEMLVEKFAENFIEQDSNYGEWLNVPDNWKAYTEEGYQTEIQWIKDNSDG